MNEIGNKIYQRRKELGLTLEEVGNAVGVGKSTVRRWENGMIKNMGRDKIAALAKVLQISPVERITRYSKILNKTAKNYPTTELLPSCKSRKTGTKKVLPGKGSTVSLIIILLFPRQEVRLSQVPSGPPAGRSPGSSKC